MQSTQDSEKQKLSKYKYLSVKQKSGQFLQKDFKSTENKEKQKYCQLIVVIVSLIAVIGLFAYESVTFNVFRSVSQHEEYQVFNQSNFSNLIFNPYDISNQSLSIQIPPNLKHIKENHKNCLSVEKLKKLITKQIMAYKSLNKYVCSNLQQRFEQYFDQKFYVMSAYGVFLQICEDYSPSYSVNRQNLLKWNRDRARIEWALRNIKSGDNVILHRSGKHNLLQIIIIAKIIGPTGRLSLVGPYSNSTCLPNNTKLYGLKNIIIQQKIDDSFRFHSRHNIIFGEENLIKKHFLSTLLRHNPQTKVFIFVENLNYLKYWKNKLIIKRFLVNPLNCLDPIFDLNVQQRGFYQISAYSITQQSNAQLKFIHSNFFDPFYQKYQIYKSEKITQIGQRLERLQKIEKQCSCLASQNIQSDKKLVVALYGNYIHGVDLDQIKVWEKERQIVEWVRAKLSKNSVVYYELKKLNLLVISEIAKIIQEGKFYILCQKIDCLWIQRQKNLQNLKSVETIETLSFEKILKADAIITDNEEQIEKITSSKYLEKGKLVGYFTRERQSSFTVFGGLIPTHNLRQIEVSENLEECIGFEYKNYFWDIDEMNNFYQITPTPELYQIFIYWRGSPKNLTISRKNSIEQVISLSKVEVKIFNKELFYLVKTQTPIHEGFRYLSATHESDYFRIFMLHNFGGAYADIKHYHFDWRPYFKKLLDDPQKYAMGYPERQQIDVACDQEHSPPPCPQITSKYKQLIGNGVYIYKKNTVLTGEAMRRVHNTLDKKIELLREHPSTRLRDYVGWHTEDGGKTYFYQKYPLRWAEMSGEHMSRVAAGHLDRYLYDFPYISMVDYQ